MRRSLFHHLFCLTVLTEHLSGEFPIQHASYLHFILYNAWNVRAFDVLPLERNESLSYGFLL